MVKKNNNTGCAIFIARISLVLLFVNSFIGKATGFAGSAGFAGSSWIPLPGSLILVIGMIMLLAGSISLILGYKLKEGAYLLALYTFLATIMFHVGEGQLGAFLKNLAIIGGLIALAQLPSGKFSLDSKN